MRLYVKQPSSFVFVDYGIEPGSVPKWHGGMQKERLQALGKGPGGIEKVCHHQTGRLTIGTFFIVHSPVLGL